MWTTGFTSHQRVTITVSGEESANRVGYALTGPAGAPHTLGG